MSVFLFVGFLLFYALVFIYLERKVAAFLQYRQGPLHLGPKGTFQTFADLVKLLQKEVLIPKNFSLFFFLAPLLALLSAFTVWGFMPFLEGAIQDRWASLGIFVILAVESFARLMAGAASENKYSLLGALRSFSTVIAYEVPYGIILLVIFSHYQTLDLGALARAQTTYWGMFQSPFLVLAAAITLFLILMASHRAPFDFAESESELIGGFLTEYSGLLFGYFMLAEYILMLLQAVLWSYFFCGGSIYVVGGLLVFFLLARWGLPRPRPDQLIELAWNYLLPMAFLVWVGTLLWTTLA
ncbi:MAG: complex I subunit 1 family protein [Bacteroidia bacterium]